MKALILVHGNLAKFVTVGEVWMISAGAGSIAFVMACQQEVIHLRLVAGLFCL